MFLEAIRALIPAPRAASIEGGNWDIVDSRTGKLLTAGNQTDSGVPVSAESALGYHGWFRAMSLIASKAAIVPKYVYEPTQGGKGKRPLESHESYWLIRQQANEEQTAFQFWLQMTGHVASRGNAYAYLWRQRSNGPVTELIPTDPDRTHPVRKNGQLWYVMFPFGEDDVTHPGYKYRAEEVLHFKGWGFDGLLGYPVWKVAANEIGLAKGERKLVSSRFKNSGRPSMILETDKNIAKATKDRIRDEWERMHTGLDNVGKTAVLDHGLKARPIALNAEDMQQSDAANMSLVAISNYTGVPVTKLGYGKPYTNPEHEDRALVNDGLAFYLDLEDDELMSKLLSLPERKRGVSIRSDREVLLSADMKTQFDVLRIATAGKPILTQNEARERIDMPPSTEPDADKLLIPLNMGQGGNMNEPNDNADDDAGRPKKDPADKAARMLPPAPLAIAPSLANVTEATRFAVAHATAKLVKRLGLHACAAASKGSVAFVTFVNSAKTEHLSVFRSECAATERLLDSLGNPNAGLAEWIYERCMRDYAPLIDSATEKTIAAKTRAAYEAMALVMPQDAVSIYLPKEG